MFTLNCPVLPCSLCFPPLSEGLPLPLPKEAGHASKVEAVMLHDKVEIEDEVRKRNQSQTCRVVLQTEGREGERVRKELEFQVEVQEA